MTRGERVAIRTITDLKDERDELRRKVADLTFALEGCVDALDRLMGDTDLDVDESREFRAMRRASLLLARLKKGGQG